MDNIETTNTDLEGISIVFGKVANKIRNNQLLVSPITNKLYTTEVYSYLDLADNTIKGYLISVEEINTELVVTVKKLVSNECPNNKIVKQ